MEARFIPMPSQIFCNMAWTKNRRCSVSQIYTKHWKAIFLFSLKKMGTEKATDCAHRSRNPRLQRLWERGEKWIKSSWNWYYGCNSGLQEIFAAKLLEFRGGQWKHRVSRSKKPLTTVYRWPLVACGENDFRMLAVSERLKGARELQVKWGHERSGLLRFFQTR